MLKPNRSNTGLPEVLGAITGLIVVVLLNLGILAGTVWVIVAVLRATGVL